MEQKDFEKQLLDLGFTEKPEEGRQKPFLLVNKPLLGRQNFRTEIDTDFYGFKITYYPTQFKHFVGTFYWHKLRDNIVSVIINDFLCDYGL